jgi:hypothetical protein
VLSCSSSWISLGIILLFFLIDILSFFLKELKKGKIKFSPKSRFLKTKGIETITI